MFWGVIIKAKLNIALLTIWIRLSESVFRCFQSTWIACIRAESLQEHGEISVSFVADLMAILKFRYGLDAKYIMSVSWIFASWKIYSGKGCSGYLYLNAIHGGLKAFSCYSQLLFLLSVSMRVCLHARLWGQLRLCFWLMLFLQDFSS